MAMALSYFGSELGQAAVATTLRPNSEDKNVNPEELAEYARSQGLEAIARASGDADVLKLLLSNGIPVMVEVWLEPEPNDGFGHFRLLTGYDNDAQEWTAYDSYVAEGLVNPEGAYAGITIPYEVLDQQWRIFNRSFVVIYRLEQWPVVEFALDGRVDDAVMWAEAVAVADLELQANANDAFAWFNRGSALVGLQQYEEAVAAYDRAFAIGLPWRMLWYQFGPLEAYYRTGRYGELLSAVELTLATTSNVEELYYWQGLGLAAQGDVAGAQESWRRATSLRPGYDDAAQALASHSGQ